VTWKEEDVNENESSTRDFISLLFCQPWKRNEDRSANWREREKSRRKKYSFGRGVSGVLFAWTEMLPFFLTPG
jgi:hypothetical protein